MIQYSVYNNETGEILSSNFCPESMLTIQYKPDNTSIIEGEYDFNKQYVDVKTSKVIFKPDIPEQGSYLFNYNSLQWELDLELTLVLFKEKRNSLLVASDWTDLRSSVEILGEVKYNAWQDYRQTLRDIPQKDDFPITIEWPTEPV